MAYIGNPVQQALTKVTSQSFNGTGSQTVFTLNRAVNTGEELEVFVENVQQEPGVGKSYTATGTTLTFDAAPQSGTGNIYVIYRGIAEVTRRLEHDPNAALAATTGTFSGAFTSPGIDDNATSTAMTLDSGNNVGIGNSNPLHKVHITHSATGAIPTDYQIGATSPNDNYQGIHNNNNSATFSGLAFETRTSGASRWLIANEWKNTYLGDLVFRNRSGGTTSQESMRIDSSGRVTMPYQPAFTASGGSSPSQGAGVLQYSSTSQDGFNLNVGGHYNTSNYRFTAPVSGNYFFCFNSYTDSSNGFDAAFRKNGSLKGPQIQDLSTRSGSNTYVSLSASIIMPLNANDYVDVATTYRAYVDSNCFFSGYLVS